METMVEGSFHGRTFSSRPFMIEKIALARADAERERQHRHAREARRAQEPAEAVAQVSSQRAHRWPPRGC